MSPGRGGRIFRRAAAHTAGTLVQRPSAVAKLLRRAAAGAIEHLTPKDRPL